MMNPRPRKLIKDQRMTKQEFYIAVEQTRLTEKSIRIAHSYLVGDLTLAGTAQKHGVGKERVREIAAKIKRRKPPPTRQDLGRLLAELEAWVNFYNLNYTQKEIKRCNTSTG